MRNLLVLLLVTVTARAQTENDYYPITTIPIPSNIILEAGGVASLPDNSVAVATRHGEIWIVKNEQFKKFASGLHEILGLVYNQNAFFAVQRTELTKISDLDKDGRADRYETVCRWPVSGNYHEYSYGPVLAPDGSMFVTTNLAFEDYDPLRGKSSVPWRGWTIRITPDGKMEPWATGMRSPCGTGWIDSSFFYADNQGDWIGSGGLVQVSKGDFTGNPAGLDWASEPNSPVHIKKQDVYSRVDPQEAQPGGPYYQPLNKENERGKTLYEIAGELPGVKTPAVWLPHGVLGTSASDIFTDSTNGKFGPFAGQVFIGDMGQSKINRVFLEKINGVYQGAAFAFRSGFASGVLRMSWGRNGELYVGQTNRGWGSTGKEPYALQSLKWTGKIPFEMKAVRAMPDGFDIEFTKPADKQSASDIASYQITHFIYKYHPAYGSPVIDEGDSPVTAAILSDDGLHVRLVVDSLRKKMIHEIRLNKIRTQASTDTLLHNTAYYTLNEIPDGKKMRIVKRSVHAARHLENTASSINTTSRRITSMPKEWRAPDNVLTIATRPGLKFDKTKIVVKARSRNKLIFRNNDDMMHNLVIVAPGTAINVGELASQLGVQGSRLNYIPPSPNVLFHTKLLNANETDTIYFEAPEKPGLYIFVCTYPGHYMLMQGILEVVK